MPHTDYIRTCAVIPDKWWVYEEKDKERYTLCYQNRYINTKSSTESELLGTSDALPQVLWTWYFIEYQGYNIKDNELNQENQSIILLENNGKGSSSKFIRHINIRYLFITDRIKRGELSVKYCPTEEMKADFFTKPLQGKLFRKFRDWFIKIQDDDPIATK